MVYFDVIDQSSHVGGIMGRDEGCTRANPWYIGRESLSCKISRSLSRFHRGFNRSYTYRATSAETYRRVVKLASLLSVALRCVAREWKRIPVPNSRCLSKRCFGALLIHTLLLQLSQRQIY